MIWRPTTIQAEVGNADHKTPPSQAEYRFPKGRPAPSGLPGKEVGFVCSFGFHGRTTWSSYTSRSKKRAGGERLERLPCRYRDVDIRMNSAEADQRIIVSRHTLNRYGQLAAIGHPATHEDVLLIDKELEILDNIAAEYPEKVPKLLKLVAEWLAFRDGIGVTFH